MGLIFPFLTYWLALTPRGRRRSGTEVEAEGQVRHRQRSAGLGTRAVEAEEPGRRRPRAASAPDYPGVSDCVVKDSSKAETKQQLTLTNLELNGSFVSFHYFFSNVRIWAKRPVASMEPQNELLKGNT